jgi:hypothetical protein
MYAINHSIASINFRLICDTFGNAISLRHFISLVFSELTLSVFRIVVIASLSYHGVDGRWKFAAINGILLKTKTLAFAKLFFFRNFTRSFGGRSEHNRCINTKTQQ